MECRHCQEKFEQEAEFAAHRYKHAKIQEQLKRTGKRTYGARYAEDGSPKGKELELKKLEQPKAQQTTPPVRSKPESTPAANSANKIVLERVQGIVARFEPYEDGVEIKVPQPAELPCPDCDFKLRNKKELDEHILSIYCRGSHIVQYPLCIDSSKPRGYYVEEVLVPFDEHAHPSEFQCCKCEEKFPSLKAMEEHEATHPMLPQICLHCSKVFGTEYELENHYDWHDDMEYRQMLDRLPAEPRVADNQNKEEDVVSADVLDLGNGLLKIPFDYFVGKKAPGLPKDGTLAGISSISREDVEMRFAPRGHLVKPDTHYYSVPTGMTQEAADRIIAQQDVNPNRLLLLNGGRMNKVGPGTPPEDETSASNPDNSEPLVLLAHGCPTGIQVRDLSGRKRWMSGDAFAKVTIFVVGSSNFDKKFGTALDEAVGWEESGNLNKALSSWKQVLELLTGPDATHIDRQKPFMTLTKLALLSSRLKRTDEAISYWCDALELSEKLYGIHSINNFNIINSIAVIFDERGDYAQAAPLYRRSLAGRLRINGPGHADTLMSMQELGMANMRLDNLTATRKLLEKACLGYENLRPRDDKMGFTVLQNLASIYGVLGMKKDARALLINGIPRIHAALGLEDKILAYALNNCLQHHEGAVLPTVIFDTIQALRQSRSEHWLVVTEAFAAFYCNNRRYRDALPLYRDAIQRRRQQHLPNDSSLVNNVHAVALCHEHLAEFVKAETAYRELASITAPGTSLHAFATQSVVATATRPDNQTDASISCVPSLLPSESLTAMLEQDYPAPNLEARFQTLFPHDDNLRNLLSASGKTQPKLLSSQALFVAKRPQCIATETLDNAKREREGVFADGKGVTAEGVPDMEMLEWLQLVVAEKWNQNGGKGPELELALIMMDWEC
ncbi:hypothetical protein MFIFM68171_08148 [Madurella fahalii]|uniref:C2H2-type domain-containing protein n=1 Tax=Madurella fahalii TaxID=1157608 RepID=A0ABQ0GJK2_9PEZI